jgi:hypothetical protein
MVKSEIQAHIHFRHSQEEVAELNKAIISMREYILAVSSQHERGYMHTILGGEYFRAQHATRMVTMLVNASKYAKAHLGDFFPVMRPQILDDALALEEAALEYKTWFEELKNETLPTH